ncbi:hypothetical protein [Acidovorax soli]|uniref:hypothetical protein n=1 Tax=Acidovorax soli TaxID=592050 RepID=UPI0032B2C789
MTTTDSKEREALRSIGEEQAFAAWFKVDCPVEGANAKIAAKAAWKACAALQSPSFDAADMATASAQGFRAGIASLAANAGSEPVALDPRHIRKFLQALQAGEMSVGRAVEILDAWVGGYYSDEMVPPPPADSCLIADDEFPMEIVRKLRSEVTAHPSPPEGMVMVPKEPTEAMLEAVDEEVGGHCYSCSKWRASYDDCRRIWAAMIAAIPPTSSADSRKGD